MSFGFLAPSPAKQGAMGMVFGVWCTYQGSKAKLAPRMWCAESGLLEAQAAVSAAGPERYAASGHVQCETFAHGWIEDRRLQHGPRRRSRLPSCSCADPVLLSATAPNALQAVSAQNAKCPSQMVRRSLGRLPCGTAHTTQGTQHLARAHTDHPTVFLHMKNPQPTETGTQR